MDFFGSVGYGVRPPWTGLVSLSLWVWIWGECLQFPPHPVTEQFLWCGEVHCHFAGDCFHCGVS